MKHSKKFFLSILISFIFLSPLTAKETQVAKDVKKALKSYVGFEELKKRGFKLKDIDSAQSLEDVYNTLLPYMIVDGVSLDNALGFYDKKTYQTFNFIQHYNAHFTKDYGTKEQLLKKGYKENEILPYFSKGKNVYRGAKFSWDKGREYPNINQWLIPNLPPVVSEKFIYFWPNNNFSDEFYPDYWEVASKKDFIIFDFRLINCNDYAISFFFNYLDDIEYKGQVIMIVDPSAMSGESVLQYRMERWIKGVGRVPRTFKYTVIGQNTLGYGNFTGQWDRFENDRIIVWGIRKQSVTQKSVDEGVGIMPDIWAENSDDIFKTIEYRTGIKKFKSYVQVFQTFFDNLETQEKYHLITFRLTKPFHEVKDDKKLLQYFERMVNLQTKWYKFYVENYEKRFAIRKTLFSPFEKNSENLSPDEYLNRMDEIVEKSILQSKKEFGELKYNDYLTALTKNIKFKPDVKEPNRQLESCFIIYNKYDVLVKEGFDIHKMDYMTKPEEILEYLQSYFLSPEGYPRDLHTDFTVKTKNGQRYGIKQTSRYIVFNNEYGSKEELKRKGYVENKTMFYYPYHDGKFWKNEKNWRTGKMIMAMPNNSYMETEYKNLYYTTDKSVYFKFCHFPHPLLNGPELEDEELDKMIERLSNEKGKENLIFDISKNVGGDGYTSKKIAEAVKKSGIKNIYIIIDKGAFSCGDHFPLGAKDYYFPQCNVTLVGYPTKGGTGSGDGETYVIQFPDFELTAEIATSLQNSETEHEGWGATPDIYADNLTEVLGIIKTLTGDNDIKPFETPERAKYNKDKIRWKKDDIIFEIK